jgi:tetratricopeptide (TPR) repeat protein
MSSIRLEKLLAMEVTRTDDPFVKFALAQEYVNADDLTNAAGYYELLLNNFAGYVPAYYHYGKLKEAQGLLQEAIAIYKKGIEAAIAAKDTHAANELKEALFLIEDE